MAIGQVVVAVTADAVNSRDIAQQLARADRPGLLRIRGNVGLDRGIQVDAPAVVQQGHGRSRQRFRDAAGTKPRARRHRRAALDVGEAEALGPHDLAVNGDGNRETRQILLHEQRTREASRLLDGARISFGRRSSHRRRHRGRIGVYGVDGEEEVGRPSTDDHDYGEDERDRHSDLPVIIATQSDNTKALCNRKPRVDRTRGRGLAEPDVATAPVCLSDSQSCSHGSIRERKAMASTGEVELIVASPRNKENLDDLLKALEGGAALIPFVGAGLSRPFEFPEWGAFLRAHADEAGVKDLVDTRLSKGEYEEAAEDLQQALGNLAFEDAIRRAFGPRDITAVLPDSAAAALPALATGPVLTTNFDNVLETAFKEAGADFEQVVCGARLGPIAQALHSNTRILWKLHGDVKDNTDRVLTNSEYAKHYGHSDPAQFDWLQPLPHAFESLLSARAVLFLGCSLEQDRTVRILRAFAQRRRGVGHYALLEDPGDDARRRERARAMSNVGVRPLWFPQKRFGLIRPFLAFLASRAPGTNNRTRIASQRARIERGIEEQRNVAADAAAPSSAEPQPVVGQAPDRPERFYGRASTLQEVAGHLASASVRLVNIHGPRGIGKTALAAHLLAGIEAGRWPEDAAGPQVDGIAYLSTRTEGITLERIYFAAARMLGGDARGALERDWKKEQLTTEDKIRQLLDALCAGCQVFLLDHFEDLLDGDGRITDAGVRTLVERSVESRCPARFIVTSGIRLAVSPRATKLSQWVPLHDGLELDDGVAMLRDVDRGSELKKLKDETLKGVVTRLHGVPRALEVFAGILADETENLDGLLERFYDRTDGVDDLFQEGINRLDLQSKRVIEALAVLGQPVPQVAIDFMLQPFEPGLDLPAVLRRLNRGNMVRMADREKGTWALHPIDQDFAYARCPETGRYSRQALHHRAAEWYASIRTPRQMWNTLEGVDPLLREFDHRVKAGLYDDAAVVLAEFDEEFRGRVGQAARSLAMHLQVEGHITIDRVRLADTIGRAHSYRHVGPIEKAIDDYRDALVMARARKGTRRPRSSRSAGSASRSAGSPGPTRVSCRFVKRSTSRDESATATGWRAGSESWRSPTATVAS